MKKFSAAKEGRHRAREQAGMPPKTRVIADKRRKPPRRKEDES